MLDIIMSMVSESQIKFLTDILVVIGEIALASLVVPYITSSEPQPNFFVSGLAITAASWLVGLGISKNIK